MYSQDALASVKKCAIDCDRVETLRCVIGVEMHDAALDLGDWALEVWVGVWGFVQEGNLKFGVWGLVNKQTKLA